MLDRPPQQKRSGGLLRRDRSERHIVRARFAFGGGALPPDATATWGTCGSFVLAPVLRWTRFPALEQHLTGPEGDRLAPVALLVHPFAPVEFGVHDDPRALRQVLGAGARMGAVCLDGEVVGLLDPLLPVAPAGGGDAEAGDVGAGGQLA